MTTDAEAVRLRATNATLLSLVERAFERFTDNDMQPPNKQLKDWLFDAEVAMGARSFPHDAPMKGN